MSPYKTAVQVPVERLRHLIGAGGATIRGIMERTHTRLHVNDDGRIEIEAADSATAEAAAQEVRRLTA